MSTDDKPPARLVDPEESAAFLHALRHELVQPVHTLGLLLDLMPSDGDAEKLQAWSQRSVRALDNLKHMLRILGDVAKLDLQPPAAAHQTVALAPLFAALRSRHGDLADLAGSAVRIAKTRAAVVGDQELLRLALDALLDNALRYAAGRPVLLGAKRRGGRLLVGVWDRGPGLDPDDLIWLQQDFQRGEAPVTDHAGAGLGLGLGLARRVAHRLGGSFWIQAVPGRGLCAGIILDAA